MGIFKGLFFDFFDPVSLISFPGLLILCAICCAVFCCFGTLSFIHSFGRGRRWHDDTFDEDLT